MIDYEKLLGIVYEHLSQACNEMIKCKDIDSDCAEWYGQMKDLYLDIQSRVEGVDCD